MNKNLSAVAKAAAIADAFTRLAIEDGDVGETKQIVARAMTLPLISAARLYDLLADHDTPSSALDSLAA